MSKRKTPRPGDVWVDYDVDETGMSRRLVPNTETVMLLRTKSNSIGLMVWEILVTRADGSTYIDWENVDGVKEWYAFEPDYLKRVV